MSVILSMIWVRGRQIHTIVFPPSAPPSLWLQSGPDENMNSEREVNLPHKRRAEAVTQYKLLCGRPTCPHLRELIQVVHLWGMRLKCSWLLLKPRMNTEALKISVWECERAGRCKTYVCVCARAGRGLEIPKQALLEMITLIKPLLSKLPPPPPPPPPPSIYSLNTLNQAQVCPDAFTDASPTDGKTSEERKRETFSRLFHRIEADRYEWKSWMRTNVSHVGCLLLCFLNSYSLSSPPSLLSLPLPPS